VPAGAGLQGMLGGRVLRKRKQVESRYALGWPCCTWLVWGPARHCNGLRLSEGLHICIKRLCSEV
jgi:hypothetical protein